MLGWTVAAATMGKTTYGRAEILDAWALPNLAKAVRMDDDRARQNRLSAFFDDIASRFGTSD